MTELMIVAPGVCSGCGAVASRPHRCEDRPGPEPAAHAAGMAHRTPQPGCPWCPPVGCPCGSGCEDAAECRRRWAGSETTWRETAARPPLMVGTASYGIGRRRTR